MKKIFLNKRWQYYFLFALLLLFAGKYFNNQTLIKNLDSRSNASPTVIIVNDYLPANSTSSEKNILVMPLAQNLEKATTAATVDLKIRAGANATYYKVTRVVDGDTIDVDIDGQITRIRLIGINTPEVVDPRKLVQCFGKEASDKAKELLTNKNVMLEADNTQDDKDKYGRLLRYVWREDGFFYNLEIIKRGYAFEYTYFLPYQYQAEFKAAQNYASSNKLGLWADDACDGRLITAGLTQIPEGEQALARLQESALSSCLIKGNINSEGEKIYHLPNCPYYKQTIIDESAGEQWFCSEAEAIAAGWRKAQNCL